MCGLRRFVPMNGTQHGPAKVALALMAGGLLFTGCLKPEKFPAEPRIEFKAFEQFGDSASLVISFTDGDGDIGLDASDTQAPFDTASTYYFNLFLEYYELRNGEWVQPPLLLPYYYRVPRITPTGQNKALEGEIAVALKPWPINVPQFDTIRFSVMMVDRALNESNVVMTPNIKVQP